jgi:hypothetical protein
MKNLHVITIHGLNNPANCLNKLTKELGFSEDKTHNFELYGHGATKLNSPASAEIALDHIRNQFALWKKKHPEADYIFIGYSQGALNWTIAGEEIQKNCVGAILLAPSFAIKKILILKNVLKLVPKKFSIPSLGPKHYRLFKSLNHHYYKILFDQYDIYEAGQFKFNFPTLIMIDAKDELLCHKKIKQKMPEKHGKKCRLKVVKRRLLIPRPGIFHLMFSPLYSNRRDWSNIVREIKNHIKKLA